MLPTTKDFTVYFFLVNPLNLDRNLLLILIRRSLDEGDEHTFVSHR